MEDNYLSQGQLVPKWHLLPCIAQAACHLLGQLELDLLATLCTNKFQHYHIYLRKSHTCGSLGVECFQPPLYTSGELCVSSYSFSFPGPSHISGRMCHRSIQTFYSSGTLLDWAPWLLTVLNTLAGFPFWCSIIKQPHHGCLNWLGAEGYAITAYKPLATERCVLCRQGFSSSVCLAVVGMTQECTINVYQQSWKEWTGWCAGEVVPNNAISSPKLADFLGHLFRVGLAWHTIGIYSPGVSAF